MQPPMTDDLTVELTFSVADPELEDEERNAIALQLLRQMRQLDEVERVDRTEDLSPEADSRAGLATVLGFLTVEVSLENIGKCLTWLRRKVSSKPIVIYIKDGESAAKIEVNSAEDLPKAEQTILNIYEKMREKK